MMELFTKKLNNRKGFTLIELIVVIAIIGILAAILIPQFGGFTNKAKQKAALAQAASIATAVETFYADGNSTISNTSVAGIANVAVGTISPADIALPPGNFTYTDPNGKIVTRTAGVLAVTN